MSLFKKWTRPYVVTVSVSQGARGRWRWFATNPSGKMVSQSPVLGYDTEHDARVAAINAIEKTRVMSITVSQSNGGE